MTKLPERWLREAKELFGEDFGAYLQIFEEKSRPSLRVNTAKIPTAEFLKLTPFTLERIPWCENGFYYDPEDMPSRHPHYYAGLYYLQEASAMVPAAFLPLEKGDRVLDCCAAPGGKSTELLSRLGNSGALYSNDISVTRASALLKNLESWGCENYAVIAEDLRKLRERFPSYFERILLDAPCSGQGMFRRDPSLIRSYSEKDSSFYAPLQKELLDCALSMLKEGGTLLYSTCTFSPEENEEVIAGALKRHGEISLRELPKYPGFQSGLNGLHECVRLYPHKVKGEGHFAALLEKKGAAAAAARAERKTEIPELLRDFRYPFKDGEFRTIGQKLYFVPDALRDLQKLRVLRSGLLIGEYGRGRFEFAHSFALALKKEWFGNVLDLAQNDLRTYKYLKGETIGTEGEKLKDGLTLVCVDSFPLGFAVNTKGTLKNKYPKEKRMRG